MKNRLITRYCFFLLGLFLVTLGNSFTILSGAGNGIWTAASLGIDRVTDLPLNVILFSIGCLVILANILLQGHFSWFYLAGELLFVFFFSELIQFFVRHLSFLHGYMTSEGARIVLVVCGIVVVCLGTSFYQRANLWMYPTDSLTDILALRFFAGNVWKGQLLAFLPAVLIIVLVFFKEGQWVGIQIGTVLALIANGELIAFFHKHAFPFLKHN